MRNVLKKTDIQRARRESLRRAILIVANTGRPLATSRELLLDTLVNTREFGPLSMRELVSEIDYLTGKDLLRDPDGSGSHIQITPTGIDVVEGATPTPTGIADMHSAET